MIYCEGKYCSRKDQCAYHEQFECNYPRQYIDQSTQGCAWGGFASDGSGNYEFHHEYYCGDNANWHKHYKALSWREGENYKNSKGTICDEVCLNCEHQQPCFQVLEYAGMVFQPGDRVRFDCEKIKENPKYYEEMLGRR